MDYILKFTGDKDKVADFVENCRISPDQVPDDMFKKASEILKCYSNILWRINSNVDDLNAECKEVLSEDLLFAIEVLDKYDYRMDLNKLEDKLMNSQENMMMAKFIVLAMCKVRAFPKKGDRYYHILDLKYLSSNGYSDEEIAEQIDMSRSNYYRIKKEAIKMFGYCLWEIILPNVKRTSQKSIPIVGMVVAG